MQEEARRLRQHLLTCPKCIEEMTNNSTDTPRTDAAFGQGRHGAMKLSYETSCELERELAASKAEVAELKKGKVFVDPKWIYDLETQLAKAHEELCQAGLREYGN